MKRLLLLLLAVPLLTIAQQQSSIADKTKGLTKKEGFITYYADDVNGKIYLEINKLDSEFLYQTSLPGGLGSNDMALTGD